MNFDYSQNPKQGDPGITSGRKFRKCKKNVSSRAFPQAADQVASFPKRSLYGVLAITPRDTLAHIIA